MASQKSEVTGITPDFALKNKLGPDVNIRDALTKEAIAEAEQVIEQSKSDFFGDALTDLHTMEDAYVYAAKNPNASKSHIQDISRRTYSLKGQSETLGFELFALACQSLFNFCNKVFREGDAEQLIVVRKHLDTLKVIIRGKMQGDGGEIGKELIHNLYLLTKKYE